MTAIETLAQASKFSPDIARWIEQRLRDGFAPEHVVAALKTVVGQVVNEREQAK